MPTNRFFNISSLLIILMMFVIAVPMVFAEAPHIDISLPVANPASDPAGIIGNIYQFSLMMGGLLAFGAIVYGGIKYTISAGNPGGQSDGKEWVKQALLGLLLLVGAVLVLRTINPNLTNSRLPELERVPSGAGGPGGLGTLDIDARNQLQAAGIGIKPGVSLEEIRQSTLDEALRLRQTCGCTVYITSGTEGSHSTRTAFSHMNGYKIDIRPDSQLDAYIEGNSDYLGLRPGDGAPLYKNRETGGIYARESDHWDVLAK